MKNLLLKFPIFLLFLLAFSTEPIFRSCVVEIPPQKAAPSPTLAHEHVDGIWSVLCHAAISALQEERIRVFGFLVEIGRSLPKPLDLPTKLEKVRIGGTYGKLPTLFVDTNPGAVFPVPLKIPQRVSWYQTLLLTENLLSGLKRFEARLEQWQKSPKAEKAVQTEAILSIWNEIQIRFLEVIEKTRYLEYWLPVLQKLGTNEFQKMEQQKTKSFIEALYSNDSRKLEPFRKTMRPERIMRRTYLPDNLRDLPAGIVILPVATDISDRKFLSEIEGALATHWNQSYWAKRQGISFHIQWTFIPENKKFASNQESLNAHLKTFSKTRAVITTGGLTTHVTDNSLVFGPDKTNARTIAHELGHLIGFSDCYLRILVSQGLFGLAILELDNPFYPDDLMCDNNAGEPRVEAW